MYIVVLFVYIKAESERINKINVYNTHEDDI